MNYVYQRFTQLILYDEISKKAKLNVVSPKLFSFIGK